MAQQNITSLTLLFADEKKYNLEDWISLCRDYIQTIDAQKQPNWTTFKFDKAEEFKARGNAELASGNNETAAAYFTISILLEPHGKNTHIYLSNRSAAFTNLAKYDRALEDADRVIALNPSWSKGYSRAAVANFFLKRYDESLAAYQKGLQIEPDNEILKSGLAQVKAKVEAADANARGEECVAKGKYKEALDNFNVAVSKDETEAAYLSNRSEAYLALGNPTMALLDADTIISIRPNWFKGYAKRGEAMMRMDKYDDAAGAYATALNFDPENSKLKTELNRAVQDGFKLKIEQS
eukprot:TRINITY_DN3382_c0_g1_i1.p1 TRINITY_DN3382_c0_g1~~TRINITY_DN3382_c0_g1_i1.p1  ORF type:complete len:302 (+),score=86.42 TRINITY_DN3382_c0_g1_i1:22-906(+)